MPLCSGDGVNFMGFLPHNSSSLDLVFVFDGISLIHPLELSCIGMGAEVK